MLGRESDESVKIRVIIFRAGRLDSAGMNLYGGPCVARRRAEIHAVLSGRDDSLGIRVSSCLGRWRTHGSA